METTVTEKILKPRVHFKNGEDVWVKDKSGASWSKAIFIGKNNNEFVVNVNNSILSYELCRQDNPYKVSNDRNVFREGLTAGMMDDLCIKIFNEGHNVLQLLQAATPPDLPHLNSRAFYVPGRYCVSIGKLGRFGKSFSGTYISIFKK